MFSDVEISPVGEEDSCEYINWVVNSVCDQDKTSIKTANNCDPVCELLAEIVPFWGNDSDKANVTREEKVAASAIRNGEGEDSGVIPPEVLWEGAVPDILDEGSDSIEHSHWQDNSAASSKEDPMDSCAQEWYVNEEGAEDLKRVSEDWSSQDVCIDILEKDMDLIDNTLGFIVRNWIPANGED